jgi:hypothetical protein
MSVQYQKHYFNVDEYYRMAEVGLLSEDDRVEPLHRLYPFRKTLSWKLPYSICHLELQQHSHQLARAQARP